MKKLNPNEAPTGYVAVAVSGRNAKRCSGCEIGDSCIDARCSPNLRKDGHNVIFIKRQPLDARLTIRLPEAVKAKAKRIGAAKVIAAIEAVQE